MVVYMDLNAEKTFLLMKEMMSTAEGLAMPPKCFVEMDGKFLEYKENQSIKMSFPVQERFTNPAGNLLGGMISAAFDNTFGPLSYLTAKKPTASLDLNITFIKYIKPENGNLIVEGNIVKISRKFILFEGKAYNADYELIATATSRMMIL
jgi:uncharacterized protein (TIGR00369 family)